MYPESLACMGARSSGAWQLVCTCPYSIVFGGSAYWNGEAQQIFMRCPGTHAGRNSGDEDSMQCSPTQGSRCVRSRILSKRTIDARRGEAFGWPSPFKHAALLRVVSSRQVLRSARV